jgi:hypothetical protein
MAMDKTRLVLGSLLVFTLGTVPEGAFGQAAAEAGLLNGLSAASSAHAASSLGAATNRALQGHAMAAGNISRPATTTVVHGTRPFGAKVAVSKGSAASTKSGHSGVATTTGHEAKLPEGIAHVWPEGALTQAPVAPQ